MVRVPIARPTLKTAYRVLAKNRQVAADWEEMLATRRSPCTVCWDHLSSTPTQPVGKRYEPLKGSLAFCEFEGQTLRQWQWEIDRGARIKVAVGKDFVVVMRVALGHPKENE
ncbi:MAG: hypothetical protein HYX52_00515 [Chloroflexi bacterium]|nr:hypothetical protein [Chloroflexota bacterium]